MSRSALRLERVLSVWTARAALVSVALIAATVLTPDAHARTLGIGVVLDGPSERAAIFEPVFRSEVEVLLTAPTFDLVWVSDGAFVGAYDAASVAAVAEQALDDPEVDIVLALGPLAGAYLAHRGDLPKPVVAPFMVHPDLQGLPDAEGRSGITNLSYVTFSASVDRELSHLASLAAFSHVALFIDAGIADAIPGLADHVADLVLELGYDATIVPVAGDVEAALATLPADVDAVWVAPLTSVTMAGHAALAAGLIERGLPSVATGGRWPVEQGLLVGVYPDDDLERIARRVALNMEAIAWGDAPESMTVGFGRGEALTLNLGTARAMEVYPGWSILTEAELIGDANPPVGQAIGPDEAVAIALSSNVSLLAQQLGVMADAEAIRQARAALLPQLDFLLSGRLIDADRARASLGSAPQWAIAPTLSLEQVLWAEGAHANRAIQQALQASREDELEAFRLDIVEQTLIAYIQVLRARAFERIEEENLAQTRSHLELARVRESVGSAGPAEVLRWEAEIATNQRNVIHVTAQRNQAEIAFNVLLNREHEAHVLLVDPTAAESMVVDPAVEPYLANPWVFDRFREFLAGEALGRAPELERIDHAIAAQQRLVESTGAAFWSPNVMVTGETSYTISGGVGADSSLAGAPPGLSFPSADDWNWQLGLGVQLPLYAGGERAARRSEAEWDLAQLQATRDSVALGVEQRVRSALHAAGASRAGIPLAENGREAAEQSLEIVENAYASGAVSIIDVLDAQSTARIAQQVAADARYDALLDYVQAQRALGWFDVLSNDEEHAAFLTRASAWFSEESP